MMKYNAFWVGFVLGLGLIGFSTAAERRLHQAGLLQQPLTGGGMGSNTLGTVGLDRAVGSATAATSSSSSASSTNSAPTARARAAAPAEPTTQSTKGFITAGASDSELEALNKKADVPVPENAKRADRADAMQPDDTVEPTSASADTNANATDPGAELALKNAGLLPWHPKLKGNVTVGSGGQADYGTHKDKLFKRVSVKEEPADGPVGGGGVADYVLSKKGIDIEKSEGPGDVIIPAGYADYGVPKLEVDVSFNKVGQSVVCHFPSPLWQGTGANPYTVKPLTMPPLAAKLFLEKQKGKTFDFPAPPPGKTTFGPGCVQYDNNCDFGGNVPCSGRGVCDSSFPNKCICFQGRATCQKDSAGCETKTGSDKQNCGSCGNVCGPEFEDCCNGACTDFDSPRNCGGCGNLCLNIGGNATCQDKACDIVCNPGLSKCVGSYNDGTVSQPNITFCVDTKTSVFACGGCGNVCPSDPNGVRACNFNASTTPNSICNVTCNRAFTQCSRDPSTSTCANLLTDPQNCGNCSIVCPSVPGGTAICVGGRCGVQCVAGLSQCGGGNTGLPLSCQNLQSNVNSCGACFRPCNLNGDFICQQGVCVPVFVGGFQSFATKRKSRAMAPLGPEYYATGNGTRYFLPHVLEAPPGEQSAHDDMLAQRSADYTAAYAQGAPASGPSEAEAPQGDPAIFMAG